VEVGLVKFTRVSKVEVVHLQCSKVKFACDYLPTLFDYCITTILGMQGNYAPGAESVWLFWAVAIPLTAGIFGMQFRVKVISRLDYCEEGPHPLIRHAFNVWLGGTE
jgi:hypothetical protein